MGAVNSNLLQIEKRVQPIAYMAETVKLCKTNINSALEQINTINMNIDEQEEISKTLEGCILNSEFNLYLMNMERAMELVKYFESDLVYFKDSFMMA